MSALTKHRGLQIGSSRLLLGTAVAETTGAGAATVSAPTSRQSGSPLLSVVISDTTLSGYNVPNWTPGMAGDAVGVTRWALFEHRTATNNSTDNYLQTGGATAPTSLYVAALNFPVSTYTLPVNGNGTIAVGTTSATGTAPTVASPGVGIEVILAIARTNSGGGTPSIATPSGFTLVDGQAFGTRSFAALFSKSVAAGATGPVSVTATAGSATNLAVAAGGWVLT